MLLVHTLMWQTTKFVTSSTFKRIISYIIPPLITVGLCYVLYADIDPELIRTGVRNLNPWWCIAFLSCNVLAMIFRGLRWRLQLRAIGVNPTFGVMCRSIFGTYAVNLVFPRLGEVWRCGYVSRVESTSFSGVFGTMVADRLADTVVVLLICVATFFGSTTAMTRFLAQTNIGSTIGDLLISPIFLAIVAVAIVAVLYVWLSRDKFACKIRAFVVKIWYGFAAIFKMPNRLQWLLYTIGIWLSYILSMTFSLQAFPATADLLSAYGAECVLVTFVFGSLAMAIPSNGGLGPWQVAIMLSLCGIYALPEAEGLVFATLNLGATTLLTILLGIATFVHIALNRSHAKTPNREQL